MKQLNKNSVVLWEGPSELDGKPIVLILTGLKNDSDNDKTGAMRQTFILRRDISPKAAVYSGEDRSICGDCRHRLRLWDDGKEVRTCYVNIGKSVRSVYEAYRRGRYGYATKEDVAKIRDGLLRLGTYGDPAAVPFGVWKLLLRGRKREHTGYTHQWRNPTIDPRMQSIVMASADSEQEREHAHSLGWRTFEVRPLGSGPGVGFQCPSDATLPKEKIVKCENCKACHGAPNGTRPKSPWIYAHGPSGKRVGALSHAIL